MKLIIARHLIPCTGGRAQVAEAETGILIESGLIRRVDRLEAFEEERRGGKVEIIDAGDSYVLPGLIDAHCHTDMYAQDCPDAEGKIMQGVTTDVCGLCGDSPAPIGQDNLEEYVKRKEYRLPDASPIRPCSFVEYRDRMNSSGNTTNMALFVGTPTCGSAGWDMRTGRPLPGSWTA